MHRNLSTSMLYLFWLHVVHIKDIQYVTGAVVIQGNDAAEAITTQDILQTRLTMLITMLVYLITSTSSMGRES